MKRHRWRPRTVCTWLIWQVTLVLLALPMASCGDDSENGSERVCETDLDCYGMADLTSQVCQEHVCVGGACTVQALPEGTPGADDYDEDGLCNVIDDDDDADGRQDAFDDCPLGIRDWADDDVDHDSDGCRDEDEDDDDDNDGVPDVLDACPTGVNPNELLTPSTDRDNDGCEDGVDDADSDRDGVIDDDDQCEDTFAWRSLDVTDFDADGCRDVDVDDDDDNDGVDDEEDRCPRGVTPWISIRRENDHDEDGCRDADEDPDDDNDGILDQTDRCTYGETGWLSNVLIDHDRDGCRDGDEDDDDDNDTITDDADQCPQGDIGWSASPDTDHDADGCQDIGEDDDDDNDGVVDAIDRCATGATVWTSSFDLDRDGDGCRDSDEDDDDDNDTIPDRDDDCSPGSPNWPSNPDNDHDRDGCRDGDEDFDDDNDQRLDRDDLCLLGVVGWDSRDTTLDHDGDGCHDRDEDLDDDNDGFVDTGDCAPLDPSIFPGREEVCNSLDDNCDGRTDEGLTRTWYLDQDDDDLGNAQQSLEACTQPTGYVLESGDCDDNNPEEQMGCVTNDLTPLNGPYQGIIRIEFTDGMFITDTCLGLGGLTIDVDRDPQIQGQSSCNFSGSLVVLGTQSGTFEGNIDPDTLVASGEGDLGQILGNPITTQWTATFDDNMNIVAVFSGSYDVTGTTVNFEGTFSGTRDP